MRLLNIPCSVVSYSRHAVHCIPSTYLSYNQKFVPFGHLQFPHPALILQDPPSSQTGTEVAWPQYSPLPRITASPFHSFTLAAGALEVLECVGPVSNHILDCEKVAWEMKITRGFTNPPHSLLSHLCLFLRGSLLPPL